MLELKNKIIALCNESGLPLEAIMFVLKDAFRDAELSFKLSEKDKELNSGSEKEEKKE